MAIELKEKALKAKLELLNIRTNLVMFNKYYYFNRVPIFYPCCSTICNLIFSLFLTSNHLEVLKKPHHVLYPPHNIRMDYQDL